MKRKSIQYRHRSSYPRIGFVAVHAGAGFHSVVYEAEYKEACKAACIRAMKAINEGLPAVEVVSLAISTLEDSPCTNAGIGSNLSRTGSIECDASIIDGESSAFGAVGALKGIRNPIQVACKLLQEEVKGPSASGLVPAIFLAGEGAFQWAREHGFSEYPDREMMTDRSIQTWKKCKLQQQQTLIPNESESNKRLKIEDLCNVANENAEVMDTVGAVCMDSRGNICAGVSSGGVVYKTPGRIGQAAVYGSGCWATEGGENCVAVACSTSGVVSSLLGCGEHLIKTMLAKECADLALSRDAVSAVQEGLMKKFLGSRSLSSVDQKFGGVLLLRLEGREDNESNSHSVDGNIDLVWGHTTRTMCIGYMANQDRNPKVRLSRMEKKPTQSLLVEGIVHKTLLPRNKSI